MKLTKKIVMITLTIMSLLVFTGCSSNKEISENDYKRNATLTSTTISDMIYNSSKEINKGPTKTYGKVAYITIDDGPSEYTDKMVEILNDNNVKATFFMVNGNMKAFPEQVKNAAKAGNTVGFHSVSHDVNKLYATPTAAKEEFDVCAKTFTEITGETSKVIRLPFGSKPYTTQSSYNNIVAAGYKLWDWTLDTEDWKSTSPQIMSTVKKYAKGDDITVLIHERKQTVAVLDEMIKYLKSEGYEILPIGQTQEEQNYWNGKLGSQN